MGQIAEHAVSPQLRDFLGTQVEDAQRARVPADDISLLVVQNDAVAHACDDGPVLLLAFAQSSFRLLPIDGHCDMARYVREEFHILRTKTDGVGVALHHNDAVDGVMKDQRDAKPIDGRTADEHDFTLIDEVLEDLGGGKDGFPRPEDVFCQSPSKFVGRRGRIEFINEVREAEILRLGVVERDIEIPHIHHFAQRRMDGGVQFVHVPYRTRLFRDLVKRKLECLAPPPFGDVKQCPDDRRLPLVGRPGRRDLEVDQDAVLPTKTDCLPRSMERLFEPATDNLFRDRPTVVVQDVEQLDLVNKLVRPVAGECRDERIDIFDVAVLRDENADEGVLNKAMEHGLTLAKFAPGLLLCRDVVRDDDDKADLSFCIPDDVSLGFDESNGPVGEEETEGCFLSFACADRLAEDFLDVFPIVGMDFDERRGAFERCRIAEDAPVRRTVVNPLASPIKDHHEIPDGIQDKIEQLVAADEAAKGVDG